MEAPDPSRAGPEEPRGEGARIAAILAAGRATRRRPSRSLWIASAIVGAICALGFVLLFFVGGEPRERAVARDEPPRQAARGAGCLGGLGLGLGLGFAIGFAVARRQPRDHSSRSRP